MIEQNRWFRCDQRLPRDENRHETCYDTIHINWSITLWLNEMEINLHTEYNEKCVFMVYTNSKTASYQEKVLIVNMPRTTFESSKETAINYFDKFQKLKSFI
jgi:hypothetical protein